MVKNHPLTPKDIVVHGLVICPTTGKLDIVVDGYVNNVKK
ncbi:putative carbonic anhydrase YvdA domain protein [[Clostridium] sordellii ATCC 9714]|nr:putative carbonic anhydrase YvdA domain protein [[Clostridium] sordellii ATCC 9714] [Paeniclostridium sordellii ATCC 9714]